MISLRHFLAPLLFGAFFFLGCSPFPHEKLATGVELDRAAMTTRSSVLAVCKPQYSSFRYMEVNRAWLAEYMDRFRGRLSDIGIPVSDITGSSGWDKRFNCVGFTQLYIGGACGEMMVEMWHSWSDAVRPAMFEVWYHPDGAPVNHSIVYVITNQGGIFVDPQVGEVRLSPTELSTIFKRDA